MCSSDLPQSLGEELQVTNFDQCLHIVMVIGKCTDVFKGIFWLVEGLIRAVNLGGTIHGRICHRGRKFL